jgi:hypothetical protein
MTRLDTPAIAWILLAIEFTGLERPGLIDILHAAEAIDHSVPTEQELRSSLRLLTSHSLLAKQGKSFQLTDSGQALLRSANIDAMNIFEAWRALEEKIGHDYAA